MNQFKQEQIQKSIKLMKQKFEAKSKVDILRYLDRLGIDVIINNPTLYQQFCQKVLESTEPKVQK